MSVCVDHAIEFILPFTGIGNGENTDTSRDHKAHKLLLLFIVV